MTGLPLQHEPLRPPENDSKKVDEAEKQDIEHMHVSKTSRLLEGAAARLQDTGKGLIDSAILTDKLGKVSGQLASHIPHHTSEEDDRPAGEPDLAAMQKKTAVTEEAFVASEYAGKHSPQSGSESPKPFGEGVAGPDDDIIGSPAGPGPASSHVERSHSAGHHQEPTKSSYYSTGSYTPPATDSNVQHELMLDMAGYKTQDHDDREGDGLKTPPELSNAQVELQERIAQGKAEELHERDPDVFALTRALLRYSESKDAQNKGHQRQPCEEEVPVASIDSTS